MFSKLVPPQYALAARLLAIAAVLVAVGLFGYTKGLDHEQAKLEAYQAQVAEASSKAAQHVVQIDADHRALNQETQSAYSTQLSAVDTYYRGLLDKARARSQSVAGANPAPSGAAGVPQDGLPDHAGAGPAQPMPADCPAQLAQLTLDAAATTVQLERLQAWTRAQAVISGEK